LLRQADARESAAMGKLMPEKALPSFTVSDSYR